VAGLYSSPGARTARLVAPLVVVVALVLLAGCGGSSTTTVTSPSSGAPSGGGASSGTPSTGGGGGAGSPGVFVGQVQGTSDAIALVTDGHRLSGAFLCIPTSTSEWIKPTPFANGKAPLVARRGTLLGAAKFAGSSASGNVTAGGARSFTAKLATGKAGLYRTFSGTVNQPGFSETGWIVLPNGNTCGATNSITSGGGFKGGPAPSTPKGQITNFANPFPF
jgi:hypothetical protein